MKSSLHVSRISSLWMLLHVRTVMNDTLPDDVHKISSAAKALAGHVGVCLKASSTPKHQRTGAEIGGLPGADVGVVYELSRAPHGTAGNDSHPVPTPHASLQVPACRQRLPRNQSLNQSSLCGQPSHLYWVILPCLMHFREMMNCLEGSGEAGEGRAFCARAECCDGHVSDSSWPKKHTEELERVAEMLQMPGQRLTSRSSAPCASARLYCRNTLVTRACTRRALSAQALKMRWPACFSNPRCVAAPFQEFPADDSVLGFLYHGSDCLMAERSSLSTLTVRCYGTAGSADTPPCR